MKEEKMPHNQLHTKEEWEKTISSLGLGATGKNILRQLIAQKEAEAVRAFAERVDKELLGFIEKSEREKAEITASALEVARSVLFAEVSHLTTSGGEK